VVYLSLPKRNDETLWCTSPYLKERMTHCSVPLHCYCQGKVDGGSEANLCQWEQYGYKVEVERVQANTGSIMIFSDIIS
jgi:hypothetical protein